MGKILIQVLGITGLQTEPVRALVQGQSPEIFRFVHFLAATEAALPSSVKPLLSSLIT
jgi:hypothetical protein